MKTRAEISELESRKQKERKIKQRADCSNITGKFDKSQKGFRKKKTKNNSIMNKPGDIMMDSEDIRRLKKSFIHIYLTTQMKKTASS